MELSGVSFFGIIVAMVAYLLGMLTIGFMSSRKTETVGDFYLGGRKLGPFVTAMSAEASDMSSWLLMGLPGVAYLSGLAEPVWTAIGLAVGTYINWLVVAKRLRRYSLAANNSITLPQFFSNRFGDKKNILTLIAALVIVIFFIPYTASGFSAIGKLFSTLFHVDYHLAMIVGAIVVIGYTMTGGFLAASMTDLVQSIIMTIALAIVLFFGINQAGGLGAVMENAKGLAGYLSLGASHIPDEGSLFAAGSTSPYGFLTVVSTLAWGLGYFGMPHILLRFMAIEDENKLTLSRRIASIWVVIAMSVAILIGVIGLGMTASGVVPELTSSGSSETIIVTIAHRLSTFGFFPALLAGLILSGIMASTMSTADSQLLAASSSVSQDILTGFFGLKLDSKKLLRVARGSLLVIAVIGVFLAWNPDSSVFRIVSFAWAGFGAAFGPIMLFSLFWRRTTLQGAIAGMVTGGAMIFIWKFMIRPLGGVWNIYELLPAFVLSALAIVIVSLVTKEPDKEVTDTFDQVAAM